ncbi:hypothetical protein HGRIS_001316 [Hohenbuehelia grisea]|uniref:Uncharacterized protein n=1 Tax=Hohenbuehelia grisea TaxID=104357 RepID=A0ABR3JQ02_9AGAR
MVSPSRLSDTSRVTTQGEDIVLTISYSRAASAVRPSAPCDVTILLVIFKSLFASISTLCPVAHPDLQFLAHLRRLRNTQIVAAAHRATGSPHWHSASSYNIAVAMGQAHDRQRYPIRIIMLSWE